MKIEVFGTKSSTYELVKDLIEKVLNKADITYELVEVTEMDQLIKDDIESVPAVRINNGETFYIGKNGDFNKSLRSTINYILSNKNFGSLPKILLPIDFSEASMNAMFYGHRLATDLSRVTIILHAYLPKISTLEPQDIYEEQYGAEKEKFEVIVNELDKDWNSDMLKVPFVEGVYKSGFPLDVISETVDDKNISMVVLGTTGENHDILNRIFGSVSLDLLYKSKQPVLAVPLEAKYKGIKNILMSCESKDFLKNEEVEVLAKTLKARIHFAHVVNDINPQLNTKFGDPPVVEIKHNNIARGIVEYAQENHIDLIVVNRKKKSFLEKLITPRVTADLVSLSKIPIMAVGG